ncbi:MAG: hypothetical protein ACTSUS_03165 [Candidatus Freyarchaeota archaeon]
MLEKPSKYVSDVDFVFENELVKMVVNRNYPEVELAGLKVGPFEEGKEYEVRFWVARELERAGVARIRWEELNAASLYKIHWRERVQSARQLAPLPEDFYPKLRRYLANLKREAITRPDKMKEYEKVIGLSRDVINCRLRKIVSLASLPTQSNQILQNLTKEERFIYEHLQNVISEWRSAILKVGSEQ